MCTQTSSNSNSNSNGKKTVRFNEQVKCKRTIHHNNYSAEERENTWMTKQDLSAIKDDIKQTLRAIQSNQLPMQRGLEFRTKTAARRRMEVKNQTRMVVFEEQADCQDFGNQGMDAEYVAALYAEACEDSKNRAALRGMMDQQVAKQIISADEHVPSMMKKTTTMLQAKLHLPSAKPMKAALSSPIRMFVNKAA